MCSQVHVYMYVYMYILAELHVRVCVGNIQPQQLSLKDNVYCYSTGLQGCCGDGGTPNLPINKSIRLHSSYGVLIQ